ncbi:MAG: PH domain-containing protein [Parvibaculaceae bacterium]
MSQPLIYSPLPRVARAHWTIYLPSVLVALVWAGVWLWAAERGLAGLKSLALAVLAIGVPVLLFFAAVRAHILTASVRGDGVLTLRSGFLRPREVSIGLLEIVSVRVRRSPVQRLLGGGALDVKTMSGERIIVNDLDMPQDIAAALVVPVRDDFGKPDTLH